MTLKTAMLAAAATAGALAPTLAAAQTQELQEVIVTARKREESILNVPVVEAVIGQQTLERFAVNDLFAVATKVPGLVIGSATGTFGNQLSMRGVGTTTLNSAIDQSVSLNIDGLQLTQGLSYKAGFFDVGQVEVLKGPQALFFGKASPAGVISVRSADPTDKLEVIARGGYEWEGREMRGELIVSGPVTDTLKLRLAALQTNADGYFHHELVNTPRLGGVGPWSDRASESTETILRGTALWRPIDRFKARLKINYDHLREEAVGIQLGSCPDGTGLVPGAGVAYIAGDDCKLDRTVTWVELNPAAYPGLRNDGLSYRDTLQNFGSLELNYDVSDALTLTSLSGWYKVDNEGFQNSLASTGPGPTNTADVNFSRRDLTQELRLESNFDSPVNFTLGAFYQDALMKFGNNSIGNSTQGFPARVIKGDHRVDVEAYSAFGQLTWKITPQIELAGGARWTHEARKASMINTITGTPVPVILAVPEISSDRLNPEFSLTYRPTDDLTLFASYKQASKSGSFNVSNIVANGTNTSFGDEKVEGGEGGVKGRLFDRTLSFNAATYYYKFTDLQVGANEVLPSGALVIRTINAASAETYGLDFDLTYLPPTVDGLSLNAAINWNHARFLTFDDAQCWGGQTIADGCNRLLNPATGRFNAQDLSGRPLTRAPEWMATFGFDYERPINEKVTFSIGSSTQFSSDYYTSIILRADTIQKSYFKTDLNLALKDPRERWEVALIGKNLTDEITTGNCVNAPFASGGRVGNISGAATRGPGGVDELACNVDRGRELWVRVTLRPFN